MSVVGESVHNLLEQNEAQENDSSPRIKPKSFFWDAIIFFLASAIFTLSISEIIVDFFKSDENSVACYYNSTLQNRNLYTYINSYCYKYLPKDKFFPLLLVAQTVVLLVPDRLWKAFFSTEFDSFFIHAARVQILRERNTGQYPIKNYTIVNYLQREFECRRYILVLYFIKLFLQLLLVAIMLAINVNWLTEINDDIMFKCSDDKERNQVFGNATCANPRKPFINILKRTDCVLLDLALIVTLFGIVRCFVGYRFTTNNYETTATICYKSCIDPQYYYKPSFISSLRWFQMNNDFEFLVASLHFGLGRVFKTILIENEISKQAVNDLDNLIQGLRKEPGSTSVIVNIPENSTENPPSYVERLRCLCTPFAKMINLFSNCIKKEENSLPTVMRQRCLCTPFAKNLFSDCIEKIKNLLPTVKPQRCLCRPIAKMLNLFSDHDKIKGLRLFDDLISDMCKNIIERIKSPQNTYKIMGIGSGYHSYMCKIKERWEKTKPDDLHTCQYITVECRNAGCGERVLLNKLEHHLKNECLQQFIKCKDCGKDLIFKDLKTHSNDCPKALQKCENCQQEIPALQVVSVILSYLNEGMQEISESGDCQTGVMLLKIPINLGTLAEDTKVKLSRKISDFIEESGQFSLIVVGPMDSHHKRNAVNQIVMDYEEKLKKKAVMLIIKPLEMDNIKNISDHFIDWKPGLLKYWRTYDDFSTCIKEVITGFKNFRIVQEECPNACTVTIKCGESTCTFQLTAYQFEKPEL